MKLMKEFVPHRLLRNRHLMTAAPAFLRRSFPRLPPGEARLFEVEPRTQLRGHCNWQAEPRKHPTLLLVHGLEGSSDSAYIAGCAEKGFVAGLNVIRMNQRNCGGTERLTSTLYHSGRSADFRAVVMELIQRDALPEIFAAGFSMGGNLVLKMAGEFEDSAPEQLRGIAAVNPSLDLASCADALGAPRNFIYNRHFVRRLKRRIRHKAACFPDIYMKDGWARTVRRIDSVREFDEKITAPFCGFAGADDYYARSSAMRVIAAIRKPTLIITAQDDPFVPFSSFGIAAIRENSNVQLVAPRHGGHCAFISNEDGPERFWAEARLVEFCKENSKL
ncbi:MAG TPA: alpha/beta fold hydrolase [Candidatus Acidoferrales bacterium]